MTPVPPADILGRSANVLVLSPSLPGETATAEVAAELLTGVIPWGHPVRDPPHQRIPLRDPETESPADSSHSIIDANDGDMGVGAARGVVFALEHDAVRVRPRKVAYLATIVTRGAPGPVLNAR